MTPPGQPRGAAVTLIPGDGVGPELTEAAVQVLAATGVAIDWDVQPAGEQALAAEGERLPQRVIDSVARTGAALKGPLTTPLGTRSLNGELRRRLDLFASVRPCRGGRCDFVVVRENHEDVFAGLEYPLGDPATEQLRELVARTRRQLPADAAVSLRPLSVTASRRVARAAFALARRERRPTVTVGHKANVMTASDLVFLEAARDVAADFPEIELREMLIDTLCGRLVSRPEEFDVLLLPNFYGDIVSDIGAALVSGSGMAPAVNVGPRAHVFEAVHGSALRLAGRGVANPTATILCGALLLDHLGEHRAAAAARRAVARVAANPRTRTYDQQPSRRGGASTAAVVEAIVAALESDAAAVAGGGLEVASG